MYQLSTFYPIHDLHLGVSKILKKIVMAYLSSDTILSNLRHMLSKQEPLIQSQVAKLRGCNAYLTSVERDGRGNGLKVDFLRGDTSRFLS